GLRLDTAAGALRPTNPVIVPGRSAERELVRRVTAVEPGKLMPPPRSNRRLTGRQIEVLKKWIDEGAKWGRDWGVEKPVGQVSHPSPPVKDVGWPRNPIDQFVLARLEAEGFRPSPEADRATLLRRVTLDLTGLPPTPEEVDTFLRAADARPQA